MHYAYTRKPRLRETRPGSGPIGGTEHARNLAGEPGHLSLGVWVTFEAPPPPWDARALQRAATRLLRKARARHA